MISPNKRIHNFKIDLFTFKHYSGPLIPLLQSAQDSYGYVPEMVMFYISELYNIPVAEIYSVITFYSQFRLKPLGKYIIKICEGTACHVNDAKQILEVIKNELNIDMGETTEDNHFSLQSVACLGCCSLAPVIMINKKIFGKLTVQSTKKILREYKKNVNIQTQCAKIKI